MPKSPGTIEVTPVLQAGVWSENPHPQEERDLRVRVFRKRLCLSRREVARDMISALIHPHPPCLGTAHVLSVAGDSQSAYAADGLSGRSTEGERRSVESMTSLRRPDGIQLQRYRPDV